MAATITRSNSSSFKGKFCLFFSGLLLQLNGPPRYNWNIVESGVKHHRPRTSSVRPVMSVMVISKQSLSIQVSLYLKQNQFNLISNSKINMFEYYTCMELTSIIISFKQFLLTSSIIDRFHNSDLILKLYGFYSFFNRSYFPLMRKTYIFPYSV
jgi:hypothetical protein